MNVFIWYQLTRVGLDNGQSNVIAVAAAVSASLTINIIERKYSLNRPVAYPMWRSVCVWKVYLWKNR